MVTSSYNALHQHLKLATAAAHSSFECVLAKRGYFDGREQYGGAWLLKQLAPLGITAAHGGSYLASYGSDRGKMWQRFLFTLEEAHLRGVRAEWVATAAIATFAAARYYLTEAEPAGAVSAARACSMVA
jgi:heme oxygenase